MSFPVCYPVFVNHGFLPQSPVRCHSRFSRLLFLPPYHAVFPQWHSPTANPWRFCNLEIPPHPALKTWSEPLEDAMVPNLRWYQHKPLKLDSKAYGIRSHHFWANLNTSFRETADRQLESPVNVLQHWVRIVTCESCAHTSQGVQPPQGFVKSEGFQVVWRFKWLANV